MPTPQDILSTQGTRLNEAAPWETYAAEMGDHFTADLAQAVADYAECRYEEQETSNQNKELLHEEKERSNELSKQYQWLTPEEYADLGARIGTVLSHAEFINRLRNAGVQCWYRQHPHADKAVLMVSTHSNIEPEVACWVQIGQMPELSIMNFDDHGIPLAERRRGWRTCLLQLILKGIITEEKARVAFGRPKESEAFHRYNQMLKSYRDAGSSLTQ